MRGYRRRRLGLLIGRSGRRRTTSKNQRAKQPAEPHRFMIPALFDIAARALRTLAYINFASPAA
jgi:hypothetical protein